MKHHQQIRPHPRLPRFHRAQTAPSFRLTERDFLILDHVCRLRLLNRDQICRLEFSPGATSSCKKRLTLLYHHGYVDRRYAPQSTPTGSTAALYCLDKPGAELVASHRRVRIADLDWRRQENDRDVLFFAHLIATNDVFISMALSCRVRSLPLEWTDERHLRRELVGQRLHAADGIGIYVPIPDAHAIVECSGQQYAFAVELDRGTVEEKRMRQKVRAYGVWAMSESYRRRFPGASLRVLFVVSAGASSRARIERLKRWTEEEQGRSLFWFADHDAVLDRDVLRDDIWQIAGQTGARALLALPQQPVRIAAVRGLPELRR